MQVGGIYLWLQANSQGVAVQELADVYAMKKSAKLAILEYMHLWYPCVKVATGSSE